MLRKEYRQTNTFMSIILMTKITMDMLMWGPFHNRSDVIVNWEDVWTNGYVKCTKSCKKTTYFCLKKKLNRKGNVRNFCLHWVIFFTKFEQYNTVFQSLFLEIIRIWELFFRSVRSYFSFKRIYLQGKTTLPLCGNQFLLTICTSYPYIWQEKLASP